LVIPLSVSFLLTAVWVVRSMGRMPGNHHPGRHA
jgi:hypothetical protein